MLLKKGLVYKIKHGNVDRGRSYRGFTAIRNSIIFSPLENISINGKVRESIPCEFLITFDEELLFGLTTSYENNWCKFEELEESDIRLLVDLFKDKNKTQELAKFLTKTRYRYNRKLDIIQTKNGHNI